jgi:2-polyprenyl-3-methyl-5-hydroxy-6-metoxy-1,4-benzoquinol methylase
VATVQDDARREVVGFRRLGLVGGVLADALRDVQGATAPTVLDCGGGSGTFAVPLAAEGARVTVVDISADALATLSRRAAEAGVADRVVPIAADVEALGEAVPTASFDLVLAHGILDAVDDADAAFAAVAGAVRPGGLVSVLIGNPVAGVLARALTGDVQGALREFAHLDRATGPDSVRAMCARHGLAVEQVHGVGVFTELVPGAALDAPGARGALADLEAACATLSPFADIAARVHVLARRPEA